MAKFVYSYEMVNLTNKENLNLHPKVIYKPGYKNIFLVGNTRENQRGNITVPLTSFLIGLD
jgi:hypothetical protein